jgi:leucyl aminopeptidase
MEIVVSRTDIAEHRTPLLVIGLVEGERELSGAISRIDQTLSGQVADVVQRGDFKGREGQTLVLYPRKGELAAERVLLVGTGKSETADPERLRRAAATSLKQAVRLGVDSFAIALDPLNRLRERLTPTAAGRAMAEGFTLGSYVFDEYKSKSETDDQPKKVARIEIFESDEGRAGEVEAGVRIGAALGRAENFARTLGNLPGNVATPSYLADRASEIGAKFGMKVTILGLEELRKESLGALLAVAQGSDQEPRLIILEHRKGPDGAKPLVLVGKGLTFDSGGISIKPAQGMEEMKFDMCGGAAVIAAMSAIGELDVAANVIGVVPSSENLISGQAMKPGDIVRSHLGKTIEVINTDAEGRLILADALSYVRRFEPAAVVDAATLTGSCVVALGAHASAVLGNDEALIEEIRQAGSRVGERVWPLPMFDEYREQIKSDYADIKNSGGRPAGTITASWFLREFVGDMPWAHLDIAGTAYGDGKLSYQAKGATGVPTRLFVEWVLARAG